MNFEKWIAERVKVSADALRATGTMQPHEHTTLFTTEIVGCRSLKMHVRTLDTRKDYSSLIQFGVVFGDIDFNTYLDDNGNAWCVWTGGAAGYSTDLWCRGKLTESKEMQIRSGSVLQTTIDCEKKTVQFAVDGASFPSIEMDVTDLQSRQLRAALLIHGVTEIEVSGE